MNRLGNFTNVVRIKALRLLLDWRVAYGHQGLARVIAEDSDMLLKLLDLGGEHGNLGLLRLILINKLFHVLVKSLILVTLTLDVAFQRLVVFA